MNEISRKKKHILVLGTRIWPAQSLPATPPPPPPQGDPLQKLYIFWKMSNRSIDQNILLHGAGSWSAPKPSCSSASCPALEIISKNYKFFGKRVMDSSIKTFFCLVQEAGPPPSRAAAWFYPTLEISSKNLTFLENRLIDKSIKTFFCMVQEAGPPPSRAAAPPPAPPWRSAPPTCGYSASTTPTWARPTSIVLSGTTSQVQYV
jgi:hypothetical protein